MRPGGKDWRLVASSHSKRWNSRGPLLSTYLPCIICINMPKFVWSGSLTKDTTGTTDRQMWARTHIERGHIGSFSLEDQAIRTFSLLFPFRHLFMAGRYTLLLDSRQIGVFHCFLIPGVKPILIHQYVGDDQHCTFEKGTSPFPNSGADKWC